MIYASMAQLCRELKLDKRRVVAASKLGLPGFNLNNTVNYDLLGPALVAHAAEIEEKMREQKSEASLKREKLQAEIEGKQLDNLRKKGQQIDPEDFMAWVTEFATELSNKARTIRKNLMNTCPDYKEVIEAEFTKFFSTIEKREQECKTKL